MIIPEKEGKAPLCIVGYVFGTYQRYIPYFLYSIYKAYPSYYVKIFVEDELEKPVNAAIELLKGQSSQFEVKKARGFPDHENIRHQLKVDLRNFYRYIIPTEEIRKFQYVYVGDVDMFILQEKTSLLEFHKNQLSKFNIPVSNCIRRNEDGSYSTRLTGLHFFKTQEYLDKLSPVIEELRNSKEKLQSFVLDLDWDEEALYKLVESEFSLERLKVETCERPWHGLHLGAARKHKPTQVTAERFYNSSFLSKEAAKEQLITYLKDPVLIRIIKLVPDRSFFNFLVFLGAWPDDLNLIWRILKHQMTALLKDIKRTIKK